MNGLYVITSPELCRKRAINIDDAIEQALQGGARIVQYRNKTASPDVQRQEAKNLLKLTRAHNASLIINDSVELCLDIDADGVHLGQSDGELNKARERLGSKILGVTCHSSIELAQQAIAYGADYCAFGAVYPSPTKPKAATCPLATITEASKLPVPICAIGGISADNARDVLAHGADMLAVVSSIFGSSSIQSHTQELVSFF